MKLVSNSILATVITIGGLTAGCQTVTAPSSQSNTGLKTYNVSQHALQANDWQLIDARIDNGEQVDALLTQPSKPLTLSFTQVAEENILSLKNTCNKISSTYSIQNGVIKLGNIMTTMMACPEPQASFDQAAVKTVMGEYTLSEDANQRPVSVITNNNLVSHFKAVPKQ